MALAKRMLMVMYVLLMFWPKAAARAHRHGMKMKAVSVYFHDIYNVTAVLVAQPPSMPGAPSMFTTTVAPFGSLFLSNDRMTEGADPASAWLGNVTVTWIDSTPYYGSGAMTTWILTFFKNSSPRDHELHGLHGTLSASGLSDIGISTLSEAQPQPITGGTGSFAFSVGSLTLFPINVSTYNQIYRLDLLLYWPPYAPAAASF